MSLTPPLERPLGRRELHLLEGAGAAEGVPPTPTPPVTPASAISPPRSQHFTAIDGARGIAIISVLLYHSGWSPRGLFGVDAFFVFSGFLISFMLLKELRTTGRIKIGSFYTRRARRLLPSLVITLGIVLLMIWQLGTLEQLKSAATTAIYSLAQIANWQQIGSNAAYWEQSGQIIPFGQMWSLSATEQFYVVWPLLMLAVWFIARRCAGVVTALLFAALIAASFVAPVLFDGSNTDRLYLGTDSRAVSFITGAAFAALVAWILQKAPGWSGTAPSARARVSLTSLSVISLGSVIAVSVATSSYHEAWLYQGGITAVSVAIAVFTATLCFPGNAFISVLSWKPLTRIGILSYSLFLLHLPIFWLIQHFLGTDTPPLFLFALGGFITWLAALSLHYALAEPLRLKSWKPTGAVIAIVVSFGLVLAAAWYLPNQKARASHHTSAQAQTDDAQAFPVHGDGELPLNPSGGPLSVAVVGDSVGKDMYNALAEYGNVHAIDVAEGGCGIFDADSAVSGEGYVMDTVTYCWPWQDKLRAANTEHSPDAYILHNLLDANDQLINDAWVSPGSPEWKARYEAQLELLVAIGAESAAETGIQPLILLSNDRAREESMSLTRERLDAVNAVAARVAAKYPNVDLLDFAGATCVDGTCLTQDAQGKDIYRDGAHFSEAGLSLLAPWLEEQIAEGLTGTE